jgi:hypothetical protein
MDQEMMGVVPTPRPDATNACGCTPHTSLTGGPAMLNGSLSVPAPEPEPALDAEAPRRSLKLVVTLMPIEGNQYRAALALGAEECDPVLRSVTVSALSDALDQIPGLLEEAEAHWRLHPRNPTTAQAPARRSGATQPRSGSTAPQAPTSGPAPDEPAQSRAEGERPAPPTIDRTAPPNSTGGQLTLFG